MNFDGSGSHAQAGGQSGLTKGEYMLALALANLSALYDSFVMPSPRLSLDQLFLKIREQIDPTWASVENAWQEWKSIEQRRQHGISPDEQLTERIPSSVGELGEELEDMISDVKYEMDLWTATKQTECCNESRKFVELLCMRLNTVMVWWNVVYYHTKPTAYCSVLLFPKKENDSAAPSGLWNVSTFDMPIEKMWRSRASYAESSVAFATLSGFSELCHTIGAEVPETIETSSLSGNESG